jgi:hypothetical protein
MGGIVAPVFRVSGAVVVEAMMEVPRVPSSNTTALFGARFTLPFFDVSKPILFS